MNLETLKETFFEIVAPDIPNEWDVEEAVESLASIDDDKCSSALKQVPVIWPVSHSLCFDYLKTVASALDCFETSHLAGWVNSTLDQYEKEGLRAAQRYMEDVERNFLCPLRGENGVVFKEVRGRLLPYLRGLSGKPLELSPHDVVHTDTTTIFVPHEVSLFEDDSDNIFMYKLIATYQWAFITCSSYIVPEIPGVVSQSRNNTTGSLKLEEFIGAFIQPNLASDVYHLLETLRITAFLERELPGLMRRKNNLLSERERVDVFQESPFSVLKVLQCTISGTNCLPLGSTEVDLAMELVLDHRESARSALDSILLTKKLYELVSDLEEGYTPIEPLMYQGEMRLDAVKHARNKRLDLNRELFIEALTTTLLKQANGKANQSDEPKEFSEEKDSIAAPEDNGVAMVIEKKKGQESSSAVTDSTVILTIDNEEIELEDELKLLADNIISDLGYLPEQYISSATGKAGKGFSSFRTLETGKGVEIIAPVTYDEWDFRRNDFRKKWCSVIEKQIPLTKSHFFPATLEKYHGQIIRLRHQFEMMRTSERFVRRQRDGDDIDLDALIESVSDARAGLAPSDRLFVRLKRDERDIAVLFLIDMSNSTQGWVNEAIKEALVLLCEALEVVGDRYGIYGFSGMRRSRSEFFHIKHLDEPYDELVKQRISSIAPREYTRMGPALRHATTLFKEVDSRVRLLITLSDGKPEDYDDYKGEYAIEDTRHALVEAKAAGIHPFCITVDRNAHDYIDHMYGSVNYIQIDDVRKLPHKMPEIYRILTN